jgi:NCS1 family nucleobase:cation symporter-1
MCKGLREPAIPSKPREILTSKIQIVAILGVVAASASTKVYGTTLWSPLTIIAEWHGSPGARAAAFFASAVWCLAQICTNISANSVSFGNDITSMAPKIFNERRGFILAAVLGVRALWVVCLRRFCGGKLMSNRCPWIIIASAAALLSFMSGYACFLAPIAGIMASGERLFPVAFSQSYVDCFSQITGS